MLVTNRPQRCPVQGDLQRWQRVVANLLDNALKYTPAGGRVTAGLIGKGDRVELSITNTGVGMTEEELPRIFQRLYCGDWSRSEYGNGFGLSLALAFEPPVRRRAVQALGSLSLFLASFASADPLIGTPSRSHFDSLTPPDGMAEASVRNSQQNLILARAALLTLDLQDQLDVAAYAQTLSRE